MTTSKRFRDFTISLFLITLLLFNYPILSSVNRLSFFWGIPVLFLYMFAVWFLVIMAIAFFLKQKSADTTETGDGTDSN